MKQILKLIPVIASFAIITSCSKSSSNGDDPNSEAPDTLDGKSLIGEMFTDAQEGDGFELDSKDFQFSGSMVTFSSVEYDRNDNMSFRDVTGSYVFEKTGTTTGSLRIDAKYGFTLNLNFSGNQVVVEGTMNESSGNLPAKGVFELR